MSLPPCPASLRPIQHYLKIAVEHEGRDPCVVYWSRLHALQIALKINTKKAPDETALLIALMDWLEKEKKAFQDNDAITNEVVAQAYLENYALKLFLYADKLDREGNYGKNVVKAFYTSGMIYDVLTAFGELTDEVVQNRKYAKWKAAYIHNCLKNGEVPVPGPMASEDNDEMLSTFGEDAPIPSTNIVIDPPPPSNPGSSSSAGFTPFPSIPIVPPVNVLPSVPHTPDSNPGGFHAYIAPAAVPTNPTEYNASTAVHLTAEQISKAQKYCKWAGSALNYDDIKTAITSLSNALQLLQTGHDPA